MASLGIENLEIEGLKVDPRYQRTVSVSMVKRLANGWDDLAAGVIIASRRKDGEVVLLDGQHRVAAAIQRGKKALVAVVYDGLSVKDEARMFTLINTNRRAVQKTTQFKARLLYGEPTATRIAGLLADVGGEIGQNKLTAVGAIERIFQLNPRALKLAMEILHEAYGKLDSSTAPATMILAIGMLANDERRLDRKRLLTVLRQRDAKTWSRTAGRAARATGEWAPKVLKAILLEAMKKVPAETPVAA
jgi:ParB-like chromosome segregation protein Spo0J